MGICRFSILILICLCFLPVQAEPIPQLKERGGYETYLEVSKDGRFVAVDHSKTVPIWDAESRRVIHTMKGFERISELKFSPDGKSIVVADYPRWIGFYDVENGFKKRWTFKAPWSGKEGPQYAGSYGVKFTPNGKVILVVDSSHGAQMGDDVVRLMSTANGKVLHSFPKWGGRKYGGGLRNFAIVDDQSFVRTTGNSLQLYSISTGKKLKETTASGRIFGLRVTPAGIICSTRDEQAVYSRTDLSLLNKLRESEAPENHPDGFLTWKRDAEGLTVTNSDENIFRGSADDYISSWIAGGGFIVSRKGADDSVLYDAQGKKLKTADQFLRPSPIAPVSNTIVGYGGPCDILDLTRGTKLLSVSFASDAKVSADGRTMAILMKNGVLLVDLAASLKQGVVVLKQ